MICQNCWLVQTEDFVQPDDLFDNDYAYFSSFSSGWLQHVKRFTQDIIKRLNLNEKSHVVEVAANDGYLLQYFKNYNIPCTGIEPTKSTALVAEEKGILLLENFLD